MILLFFLACQTVPAECELMCKSAADTYGACLDGWGLDWEAAGYADKEDYLESCRTWAWEQGQLLTEAGQRGGLASGCATREADIEAATCEEYADINWSAPVSGASK